MSKEERPKIIFQEKEMNLLEAKAYVFRLNWGIIKPKLNDEEEHEYLKWKYRGEGKEDKNPTKERYLIQILKQKIDEVELKEKRKYINS